MYIYQYPAVFLLLFSWLLFLVFYAAARGRSAFVVLLYLMALMMLPLLGSSSVDMANIVSYGFLLAALTALACVMLAQILFPVIEDATETQAVSVSNTEAAYSAWLSLLVVLPPALLCLLFGMTGALLPLLMIAILAQKPDFATGAAGGKALILANLGGGLAAVLLYHLILISPTLPFTVLALVAVALMFGTRLFEDKPTAPLWGSAFSTMLVLIGSGTGAFGDEADAKFYQRIFQITLAVCYIVAALSLLHHPRVKDAWLAVGRKLSRLTPNSAGIGNG